MHHQTRCGIALHDSHLQGKRRLQAAISGGQYEMPEGIFFGGAEPTWSNLTLRQLLRENTANMKHMAWIDVHTGPGRAGHCERIFMGNNEHVETFARANAWWGKRAPLTHAGSAASGSALLTGLVWNAASQECPEAEFTGICLKFGTKPLMEVADALRGDHWLHLHPEAPAGLRTSIKRRLFEAFYVDTEE